ncbi:hypothetical protein SCOR_14980 [Sulfidibacter corallicola]
MDSLSELVRDKVPDGFRKGDMIVFCNKKRDRVKILHFDGNYDLFDYKLDKLRVAWPEEGGYRAISRQELERFLDTGAIITGC